MRRVCLRGVVAVIMVSLPMITAHRVRLWSGDERGLWMEAVAHSPQKPRPWINLGTRYARDGEHDRAMQAYHQAAHLAMAPDRLAVEGSMRGHHVAMLNLAILHAMAGRYDEALALTADIQPRAEDRQSPVNRLETQWRAERAHGGPSQDF